MRIGTVEIQGRAALAPMAGVADRAFRKICVDYGAGYVVGEMVSCKGLCFQDAKSRELLRLDDELKTYLSASADTPFFKQFQL